MLGWVELWLSWGFDNRKKSKKDALVKESFYKKKSCQKSKEKIFTLKKLLFQRRNFIEAFKVKNLFKAEKMPQSGRPANNS